MSRKNINVEQMRSVQASIDDLSHQLSDPDGLISDSSLDYLLSASDAVTRLTSDIKDVVSDFNRYLNGVADAFEKADIDLAASIEKGKESFTYQLSDSDLARKQMARKSLDKRKNSYYYDLP